MNHYPLEYSAQLVAQGHAGNAGAFHPSLKPGGHEDRDSQSPSEDGSAYFHYPKSENELEEDSNASLIAQTLNTDGTPKRPMNAFMIFARRRRPQVAAENQAMRTGEISKILSKEWNAMKLTDKQFYLDQAKQLKDIFNSKYPDYVYRRRPNNSRRKRGTGAGGPRALNYALPAEMGGDESGNTEFDDISFDEDLLADVVGSDLHYPRMPTDMSPTYDMHSRASSYNYPSSDASTRSSHGRAPYPQSGHQQRSPDVSLEPPHIPQSMGSTHHYQQSYPTEHQSQSQSQGLYGSEHGTWDPSNGDHARMTPMGWLNSQDRPLAVHVHGRPRTPSSTGLSTWGRATSPAPPASINGSSPSYPFPTLNSPFFPPHSHITGDFSTAMSLGSAPAYHQLPSGLGNSQVKRAANHFPSVSNRDMYQQQTQHVSAQSMSSISIPHIHTSSPASSGPGTPGLWPRNKTQGYQADPKYS